MGDVLAFVEQRGGSVRGVAHEVLSVARTVAEGSGGVVHALALGAPGLEENVAGLGAFGAEEVRVGTHEALDSYAAESYAETVADAARVGDYSVLVFPASAQGKDLAPRVAALLDVPLATEVTEVRAEEDGLTLVRPVYAGKAFARVRIDASPVVFSVRPNVFQPRERPGAGTIQTFSVSVDPEAWTSRVVGFEAAGGGDLDVAEASIVVSGGRGMKGPENWELLEELRDAVGDGAALGASRAVVDAGWRPHGEQVGQTGKTVSPRLYFAVGISGAIQHLAGMRTSQTIVAVNKDADAPIFGIADYGVVGDLFDVLPRLTREIRALRSEG